METQFFIRKNNRYVKIKVEDIWFIEAAGNQAKLIAAIDEFLIHQNLSQFEKEHSLPGLMRIHRSFMINLLCVDSFDHSFVYIGEHKIPMGARYKENFFDAIELVRTTGKRKVAIRKWPTGMGKTKIG